MRIQRTGRDPHMLKIESQSLQRPAKRKPLQAAPEARRVGKASLRTATPEIKASQSGRRVKRNLWKACCVPGKTRIEERRCNNPVPLSRSPPTFHRCSPFYISQGTVSASGALLSTLVLSCQAEAEGMPPDQQLLATPLAQAARLRRSHNAGV